MRKIILTVLLLAATAGLWATDSSACGRRRHVRFHPCDCAPVYCPAARQSPSQGSMADAPLPSLTTRKGKTYRVIATNDRGNYEHDLPAPASLTGAAQNDGIHFAGKARKVAKTSIALADTEKFDALSDLLDPLLSKREFSDQTMREKIAPNSPRVDEEKRNVTVKAFLYATKKEADNDYHLLLGPDPAGSDNTRYMTAEISGLPSPANTATGALTTARRQFEDFIQESGGRLPGTKYMRFQPPIPVVVTGSMFFDIDHSPGDVGTGAIIPKSVWEIHPITTINFEP